MIRVTLITLLLGALSAAADDIDASVCYFAGTALGVRPVGEASCYRPVFADPGTRDDFSNLIAGDTLNFNGWKFGTSSMEIESISTVGLYNLIGKWKDAKGRYYNFADYENVAVYDSTSLSPVKTESYYYELYPNSTWRWGVSLTNPKTNRVGLLRQFADKNGTLHFEICLYENNVPTRKRVCSTLERLPN